MPREAARRGLGLPLDAKVVLLIAAHLEDWVKGTALAFDVIRQMRTRNVRLVVVGDAPPETARQIPAAATYLGYLRDDAALARVYRAADLLLVPSLGENFPYVALEALACRTPVAAFRVGGLIEIVGENQRGVLARPFDTGDLAAAIDDVLADKARRDQYGLEGRRWVEEMCDVPRSIEAHMTVYRQAIADFARRGASDAGSGVE
jgi:glycosyltransferase involved in cell wall biosynthesis